MLKTILVCLFLLFGTSTHSQPDGKAPPANPKHTGNANKGPSGKGRPSAVALDKMESPKQEEARKQREEDRKLQIEALEENKRLGTYTLLLAIFTFGLGAAAIWQASVSSNSAKRQLRAYVGIIPDPNYPPPTLAEMHTKGLQFHIVNYGKTPAHYVCHEIAIGRWFEEPIFKECERPIRGSKFVLHPGTNSELKIAIEKALSEEEKSFISNGTLKFYVWGKIWYQDAFKVDRWTTFRWRQGGAALQWTETGNDAN